MRGYGSLTSGLSIDCPPPVIVDGPVLDMSEECIEAPVRDPEWNRKEYCIPYIDNFDMLR